MPPVAASQLAAPSAPQTDRRAASSWTEADDADLACLVRVLVDGILEHRPQCASCAAGYPPCPHVRRAIEIVVEWRDYRSLLSRARSLRHERELLELRRDRALHEAGA